MQAAPLNILSRLDSRTGYDLIVVGSGFSASFFLQAYLRTAPTSARVLVIERGSLRTHRRNLLEGRNSDLVSDAQIERTGDKHKHWNFTLGFGGGSACWWGNVPRMLPNDFRMHSRYGVGRDWPLSYAELQPFYAEVELSMAVSGPTPVPVYPQPASYRLPPHLLSDAQAALADAHPGQFFALPTARASTSAAGRPACAATGTCWLCPRDAKFTVQNGLMKVYDDPRVAVILETEVVSLERRTGVVSAVVCRNAGGWHSVRGEICVLATHALFNPAILLRSGFVHPQLGCNLHEQIGLTAEVFLRGLKNFNGSSSVTGVGYMGYDGAHRRKAGACMMEAWNIGTLRAENGRWQDVLKLRMVIEDLPQVENRVTIGAELGRPRVHFNDRSSYGLAGVERARRQLPLWLQSLPIERINISPGIEPSESHIQGTTVMGHDPSDSVLDSFLRYHGHDNLFVLGSGAFPSGPPANPTLTLSALALRAASSLGSTTRGTPS